MTMTEHNDEPLWVGMDVDAELARYAEQDRRRAEAKAPEASGRRRSRRRRVLGAPLPASAGGLVPPLPLAA